MCIHWKPSCKTASRANSPNRTGSGSGRSSPTQRSSLLPPRSPYPRTPTPSQPSCPQSPNVRSRQLESDAGDKRDESLLLDDDPIEAIAVTNLIQSDSLQKCNINNKMLNHGGASLYPDAVVNERVISLRLHT